MEDFLRLLGFDLGGKISTRAFYPKTDERAKDKNTAKHLTRTWKVCFKQMTSRNNHGQSIYLVINGPGLEDDDIKLCRAIFYEHDTIGKEVSTTLWQHLGLPQPSFQVDTGGKSIHSYWVLSEPVAPDQWKPLQADLIELADGDRQCKNPSRVMRCPGFVHPETGQMAALINITDTRYSFDKLRSIVPVVERQAPRAPFPVTVPPTNGHSNNGATSLGKMIAVKLRPLLKGAQDGSRNGDLYALGLDLAGVEQWCASNGYPPSDRAWDLFYAACLRSNPPMGSKPDDPEPEEMWARILSKSPTPSLSDDKLRNILERKTRMSDRNGHKGSGDEGSGDESLEEEFGLTSDTTTIESLENEILKLKEDLVNATPRSPESIKINREIDAKSHKLKTLKRQTKPLEKKVSTTQVGPLAEDYLYSDKKWICYSDELYFWTGNYYKKSPDEAERFRITSFLNALSVPVQNDDGSFSESYPFRETKYVIEALKWVKFRNEITQEMLNPPGFNCKNGVIECHWNKENRNDYKFVPHDPLVHFYLTPPNIDYNPNADPWHYNKLMECLEPEYRTIWERTIASALDLRNIRIIKGSRTVRALLLKGDGSNGKDTLKFLVQQLFGHGKVSSCSFADFKQYDEGNRFSLYALQNKAINWPSENVGAISIENLQSLKSAITGDTVYFEAKGRNAIEGNPQTVFMFNINKSVDLMTQLTALESRWAILPFDKTYSDNPRGDHELQADPRFKEDDRFVQEQVAPAFLNRLLKQLQDLAIEGIDFSPTKKLMTEMQQQTCHLLQFCADVEIEYKTDSCVFVEDIWKRLYTWYEDNAYLEIGDYGKKTWTTSRNGDQLIKSSNQVSKRFLELFPKATPDKRIKPTDINRNDKTVIKGITMKNFEYRAQ